MSKIIDAIENEQMEKDLPEFAPGDTVNLTTSNSIIPPPPRTEGAKGGPRPIHC